MIREDIFATTGRINVGFTGSEYQIEYTDAANSSSISWDGTMDAYALGYINPDLLPDSMAISSVFITEETNVDDRNIVIQRIKPNSNAQIGYAMKSNANSTTYYRIQDGVSSSGDLSDMRFVNNFYPEFIATKSTVTLNIKWFVFTESNILSVTQNITVSFDGDTTYYSWQMFKQGSRSITTNLTISGNNYGDVTFNYNDFIKGKFSGRTSTSAEVVGYCIGFSFPASSYRSGYNAGNLNYAFVPLINYSGTYSYGDISGSVTQTYCRLRANQTTSNAGIALYNFTYNSGQGRLTNIYGWDGFGDDVFNVGELKSIFYPGHSVPQNTHINTDNTLVVKEDLNPQVIFRPIRKFDEIDEVFALYSRFTATSNPPVSYRMYMTYCCDVNDSNVFSIEFKTGDFDDENFKNSLQPWQYVDRENPDPEDNGTLNTNEFDPTDPNQMPPYTPAPPPEPSDEGHNPDNPDAGLGDVEDTPADQIEDDRMNDDLFVSATNSFITQYVLTYSELTLLGANLWSAVIDPNTNVLRNFAAILSDTGTFNIGNIMQCFVSLKVFPFNLFDTEYSETVTDLRAGSGYTALLNSEVTIYNGCTHKIDCGTVDVTAEGYNIVSGQYDFRNYINTTVCVFLPYCGTVELNPSDVFGFTLSCTYYIDITSGTCTACVFVDRGDNKRLMVASKSGQIGFNIPMSATNAGQVAGVLLSDAAHAAQTVTDTALSVLTSHALGGIGKQSAANQYAKTSAAASDVGKAASGVFGAYSGLGNMFSRSGCAYPSLSGGTGMAALFFDTTPYIVIRRSNYSSPNSYAHTTGFATTDGGTEHKSTLGAYSGWTVVKNCDLKNIHANREELDEIRHLLETGVFM